MKNYLAYINFFRIKKEMREGKSVSATTQSGIKIMEMHLTCYDNFKIVYCIIKYHK